MKRYKVMVYNTQHYLPVLIYNYQPEELLKSMDISQGMIANTLKTGVFEFIVSPGEWDKQREIFTPHQIYEFRYIDSQTFKKGNFRFPLEKIIDAYGKRMILIPVHEKKIMDLYSS